MKQNNMKIIGITGGIGAGKSKILDYIQKNYNCYVLMADEVAHLVKQPGERCYDELTALLGTDILDKNGQIHRQKMAEKIFANHELLALVNQIIHPAVKEHIVKCIQKKQAAGNIDFFFIEAALLIEEEYDKIADELWYIRADAAIRRQRLKESRGYSDERINSILERQLSEEEFQRHCVLVIDNSGKLEETYSQIRQVLEGYQNE